MVRYKRIFTISVLMIGVLLLSVVFAQSSKEIATIIVHITGFRNNKGVARITLFDKKKGFPNKYKLALAYGDSPIQDSVSQFIFHKVVYGKYSIGVFHDEDSNGKLKSNIIGMPREGIGVSNNVRASMGPPKFKDCLFSVDSDTVEVTIDLNYL